MHFICKTSSNSDQMKENDSFQQMTWMVHEAQKWERFCSCSPCAPWSTTWNTAVNLLASVVFSLFLRDVSRTKGMVITTAVTMEFNENICDLDE